MMNWLVVMNWGKGGMMGGQGFGILCMIFGLIFMLLFFTGIILLIVWIVRQFASGGTSPPQSTGNALKILKERFAKGEISREEFAEMKKELMK